MKQLKRILLINAEYPPISGGGGIYTFHLAQGLASKYPELQVIVVTGTQDISTTPIEETPLPNLKVLRYRDLHLIDQGATHIWQVSSILGNVISCFCPDLVHTHHTYESFSAFLCKQLFDFKLIITIQKSPVLNFSDWKEDPQWSLIRFCYEHGIYDGVVVNSQAYYEMAKFFGAHEPIKLIYYGIDKSRFRQNKTLRSRVRKELGLGQKWLVLCPSRIDERKGIDILIKAVDTIKKSTPRVYGKLKVIVAGAQITATSNDYHRFLTREVQRLKLDSKVILGYRDGAYDNMNSLYNAADLVVLPSLREGLGFAAIEGMKVKKPVIASDTLGLREIIKDGENGLLFKVGDAKQLAERIIWCLSHPKKLKKLAFSGWKFQKDRFTIPQMVDEHLAFYQNLFE